MHYLQILQPRITQNRIIIISNEKRVCRSVKFALHNCTVMFVKDGICVRKNIYIKKKNIFIKFFEVSTLVSN